MNIVQMAILSLFEKVDSLTGKNIQESLELDYFEFWKNVASLVENNLLISKTKVSSCLIHIPNIPTYIN